MAGSPRDKLYGRVPIQLVDPPPLPQFPYEESARSIARKQRLPEPSDERALRTMLIEQYLVCGFGTYAKQVRDPKFNNMLRLAVWGLRKANVSLRGFVKYVCAGFLKRSGEFPYPAQVFGQKAIAAWLPRYTRNEAGFIEVAAVKLTRAQIAARELEWRRRRCEYLALLRAKRDEANSILVH